MTNQNATVSVARSFMDGAESKTPQEVSAQLGIPLLQTHKVFKQLFKEGVIASIEKDDQTTYVVVNSEGLNAILEAAPVNPEPVKETPEVVASPSSEGKEKGKVEPKEKAAKGRHTGMFIYKKASYNKSQCALKVVTDYVTAEKPTLAELEKAFPKEIVSRFGVFNTIDQAKELSKGRDRYYMKEGQILTTSDGHQVVVTTQWTFERIMQFSDAAAAVGIKFKQA